VFVSLYYVANPELEITGSAPPDDDGDGDDPPDDDDSDGADPPDDDGDGADPPDDDGDGADPPDDDDDGDDDPKPPRGKRNSFKTEAILPIYIRTKSTGTRRIGVKAILDRSSPENCVSKSFLGKLKKARDNCPVEKKRLKLFDRATNTDFAVKQRVEIHWILQGYSRKHLRKSDFIVSPADDYEILLGSNFIREARKENNLDKLPLLRNLLAAMAKDPKFADFGRAMVRRRLRKRGSVRLAVPKY
jgi:hypothetical protein